MSYIVITDKEARIVREVTEKTIPLSALMPKLAQTFPYIMTPLPKNCHTIICYKDSYGFVIEQPPRRVPIQFTYSKAAPKYETYTLNFPWIYFGISIKKNHFNGLYAAFSPTRVEKTDHTLGTIPFPNINRHSSYGLVCLGSIRFSDNLLPGILADQVILQFWNSKFNSDHFTPYNFDSCPTIIYDACCRTHSRLKKLFTTKKKEEEPPKEAPEEPSSKDQYSWDTLNNKGTASNMILQAWEEISTEPPETMALKFDLAQFYFNDFLRAIISRSGADHVIRL